MKGETKLMEDKHLIERCLNGEKEVYELMVKKYQSMVIALAMSITSSIDDAKDIAQESFVRAYLKLSKFNSNLNFKSWIMRIAYNCSIDHIRKRKSFLKYFNFKVDQGLNEEMKKYKLVSDSEIFSPHIKKLKPRERAILLMRYDQNLSTNEIGEILSCSPKTIRVHIFNARNKLKKHIEDMETKNG